MSIMNTSVSGMEANTTWLSSISQNVANSNTTGYKDIETDFTALVDQSGAANSPGWGVTTSLLTLNSLQGSVADTSTSTNLAIQGNGFFVVEDASGNMYLSRDGSFTPDSSGNLVNASGGYLLGYDTLGTTGNESFNSLSGLQKVNVSAVEETGSASTSGTLVANLPSSAAASSGPLPSTNSASSVYTDEPSLVAYDDLGAAHTLDVYFTKTGANTWEADVFDHSAAGASGGFPYSSGPLATATLNFNPTSGALTSGSPLSIAVPSGQTMSLNLSGVTQNAGSFSVSSATANGNAPGSLTGMSFNAKGQLSFQYSNGTSQIAYQIPLGAVTSPDQLTSPCGGFLSANENSGGITVGVPSENGLGTLVPSALENSTVDLATQLTEMIQAQSAYEANSKVFQTGANIFDILDHINP